MSDLIPEWLADAIECAGIQTATDIEDQLIGDLDNRQPTGIVRLLTEGADDVGSVS